jgi:hypothetical protein
MPFGIINAELKDGGQIPGTEMLIGGSRAGLEAEAEDTHLQKITYRARIRATHMPQILMVCGLEAN